MSTIKSLKLSLGVLSFLSLAALPAMAQEMPEDFDEMDETEIIVSVPTTPQFEVPVLEINDGGGLTPISFEPGESIAPRPPGGPEGGGPGGPGGPGGRGHCGPMGCLSGENALTDEQRERMYQLKNKMLDEMGPKMAQYSSAKRHLRDVLTQESIDSKEADRLQKQIIALKTDMETMKLSSKAEMAQVLTGSQRKAIRQA
ncbi:MAG: periplasmic heavy metal sensor, partial [Cyanobacteria bacterium]|nr:periplasmic heavy metal sensor [Cyanobacteriota bacterium]